MRILPLIAVAVFLSALAATARAGMEEDCIQSADPDLKIGGCTAAIRSGQWQGKEIAWAYNNRGNAYDDLHEYRRAIEDYDQALRLDPEYAYAYIGRAFSLYLMGGRNAEALADADRSLSLDPGKVYAISIRAHVLAALGRRGEALAGFERAMRVGGADRVRRYQEALAGHGYYRGIIDGAYGPKRRAALAACLDAGCRLLE